MRSWAVLAAVVVVAVAATADALRRHSGASPAASRPPQPTTTETRFSTDMGALYYTDPSEGCLVRGVTLPNMGNVAFDPEHGPPPKLRSCRFSLSPDGRAALPGAAVWQPQGRLVAVPRSRRFELTSLASGRTIQVTGTAPAFKPDGTLTYVRGGRAVAWTTRCFAGERPVAGPGDEGPFCAHTVRGGQVRNLVWLTNARFVGITTDARLTIVASGRTVIRRSLAPSDDIRAEVSPHGRFFTLWVDGRLFAAFNRDGGQIAFPPLPDVRSVAWARSERWAALATARGSVYLFRPNTADARLRRLDISARDLAWR